MASISGEICAWDSTSISLSIFDRDALLVGVQQLVEQVGSSYRQLICEGDDEPSYSASNVVIASHHHGFLGRLVG
jgi:hypothetical protein